MPNLIVLRGDEPTRTKELILSYREALGDPSMADLNTTLIEGDALNLEVLRTDVLTMPFLSERRLVIVSNLRAYLGKAKKEERQTLLDLLTALPDTALLVLTIEDISKRKRGELTWENEKSYGWLNAWAKQNRDKVEWVDCPLPSDAEMATWILKQAKQMQGGFEPSAANLLASYIGNNTLRARQEIEKLITYVGPSRVVTANDVVLLTAQEQEGNIFSFTDALGERDSAKALAQFEILQDQADIVELAPMIHRQFRLLIQVREILDEGGRSANIEKELNQFPFIAEKLSKQAKMFSMSQLLAIYKRLLKIDEDMKTGGMPGDVAFELFIADLTRAN